MTSGISNDIGPGLTDAIKAFGNGTDSGPSFQTLVESANAALVILRDNGFLYVNPAVEHLTGYSVDEMMRMDFRDLLHPEDRDEVGRRAAARLRGEPLQSSYPIRLLHRDGSTRHTSYTASLIELDGGPAILGVLQDVTETEAQRRRAEERFRQAEKMEAIGTLVGGIAHDFNNILAGIAGNVHLARMFAGNGSMEKVGQKLQRIDELSIRAAGMIRQLLAFARKDMVRMKPLEIHEFVPNIMARERLEIPRHVELTVNVAGDALWVNGDASQLQQALLNLCENALVAVEDAAQPHIDVCIAPFQADEAFQQDNDVVGVADFVRISISDNGCGIEADILPHIFEPFFTTRGVGSGSGLGLSMVYGAVQMHGGVIEVDSRPGAGTTFHLFLPRHTNGTRVEMPPLSDDVMRGKGERILCVDDDKGLLAVGSEVLRSLGYEVLAVSGGREAVSLFREQADEIDLVLLDVVMPDVDGRQAAEQMLAIRPDVRLLFVTGYDKLDALSGVDDVRASDILVKPYSTSQLSRAIRRKLDT